MGRVTGLIVAVVLLSATLAGQQAAPAFEVASIRPSGNTNGEHSEVHPSGQFIVTNTRLSDLIRAVFEVQRHELVFGDRLPSWVASEKWDIIGKGPPITDEVAPTARYWRQHSRLPAQGRHRIRQCAA